MGWRQALQALDEGVLAPVERMVLRATCSLNTAMPSDMTASCRTDCRVFVPLLG
jgi:hypothetical protein